MRITINEHNRPIHFWTDPEKVEPAAFEQLKNISQLPFIDAHGIAVMPDVHLGMGATVGSVIATTGAIVPAAVGVDIGCGMNAVRLSLKASDLPESLKAVRQQIERNVPLGAGGAFKGDSDIQAKASLLNDINAMPSQYLLEDLARTKKGKSKTENFTHKVISQLGTLGSGNHFIEVCLDENQDVWVMLHSGSRGIGNIIGRHFIARAKRQMERFHINLPDKDLAYLPENTKDFDDYVHALTWAQDYAALNREAMMGAVLNALKHTIDKPFSATSHAINCHHNYATIENHFGRDLWVTRKGAIRARKGDLGIIPGSMGQRSYIVEGLGNEDSYQSCAHGAGRVMSRNAARKAFTVSDLKEQTKGVECRKDNAVIDEIPSAYKNIDEVMAYQDDLVRVKHTLKQVLCVKGA